MIGSNINVWRGIEETGGLGLGYDSPPTGIPCGKWEAVGLTTVEMMIFIQKILQNFWPKGKNEKVSLLYSNCFKNILKQCCMNNLITPPGMNFDQKKSYFIVS